MAEPKKETVRIALPPSPETQHGPQNGGAERETARIVLPSRTPAIPLRRSPPTIKSRSPINVEPAAESSVSSSHRPPVLPPHPATSPLSQPLPKPVGSEPLQGASVPVGLQASPKKETERVAILPKPAVNMMKMQPLITRPAALVQPSPILLATSNVANAFESISRWLCWGVFGISALILFIQIWNYAVS